MNNKPIIDDNYRELARVLSDAMEQASGGKGRERHADGERFENQKICVINRWLYGSPVAGPLFQVVKKTVESSRMTHDAAIRELYGAINYAAAGIKLLEELRDDEEQKMRVEVPPLQIEMNCLCLGAEHTADHEANAELRRLERSVELRRRSLGRIEKKALDHVKEHGLNLPDEMAVFEEPLCEDCSYMHLLPSDFPCKKCIDKPFRPHFTGKQIPSSPGVRIDNPD